MKPLNTDEQYLYAIANGKPERLKPANRKEAYLKKIAEFHARGGSGAVDPADITKAVNNYLEEHPVIETMTKAEMLDILRGGENA